MHYFLHFCIHENALTVTQNAPVPELLGAFAPDPSGDSASCIPAGAQPPDPRCPPARSSGSATGLCVCVCVCVIRRTAGRRLLRHRGVSCRVRRLSTGLVAVVRVRPSVSLNWSSSSAPSTDACVSVAVSRSTSAHCCSDQCAQLALVSGQWEIDLAHCCSDQCAQLAVVSGQWEIDLGSLLQ